MLNLLDTSYGDERIYLKTFITVAFVTIVWMFSDTLKGSVDLASARVRYLYDKAATNVLGPEDGSLSPEKQRELEQVKKLSVGGLYNEGNTCFMNSVIQSLASCEVVEAFLDENNGSAGLGNTGDLEGSQLSNLSSQLSNLSSLDLAGAVSSPRKSALHGHKLPGTLTPGPQVVARDSTSFPNDNTSRNVNRPVAQALSRLFAKLNDKKPLSHTYSTNEVIHALGAEDRWNGYDQEDAQEFFQMILLGLEKELKRSRFCGGGGGGDNDSSSMSGTVTPIIKSSDITSNTIPVIPTRLTPFDGVLSTRVGCVTCGEMEGIRQTTLSSIDLSLQDTSDCCLEDLLAQYCEMEVIPGVECYRCSLKEYRDGLNKKIQEATTSSSSSLCNMYQDRILQVQDALNDAVINEEKYKKLKPDKIKALGDKTKQNMFSMPLSKVLMIHINRSVFDMSTGYSKKNYAPITFPLVLDMSPFTVDPTDPYNHDPKHPMRGLQDRLDENHTFDTTTSDHQLPSTRRYKLRAAVVHYGSHNFGHYVCFRQCNQGFWWRISDHSVDLSSQAQVLRAKGVFMLFYEQMSWKELAAMQEPQHEKNTDLDTQDQHHNHSTLDPSTTAANDSESISDMTSGSEGHHSSMSCNTSPDCQHLTPTFPS